MDVSTLSWKELSELPKDTLFFLSLGPLEAHGPHLPVATDFLIAQAVTKETIIRLERLNNVCALLPSLPLGSCRYLEGFPGTVSIRWKTLSMLLYDLLMSFAEYGFSRAMIVNFHMDLWHVKAIHRTIKKLHSKGMIVSEPLSALYYRNELFEKQAGEIHADINETSLLLHLNPNLVKNHNIPNVTFEMTLRNSLKRFKDIGAHEAYIGRPSKANSEIGSTLFETIVQQCVDAALLLKTGTTIDLPPKIRALLRV